MGSLDTAKLLGGIGSILELIPGASIIGYILTLIAVKYISDALQDRAIFNNMLYAVITGIVGVAVGVFLLFTGAFFSIFTLGMTGILGVVAFLAVVWIALVISAVFIRRSFDEMSSRLNVRAFHTAGTLYFVGAILTIVVVGFLILLVAYLFQIIAFFSIRETMPSGQPMQPMQPGQTSATMSFCTNCGAQLDPGAKFCKSCGKAV